MQMLQAKPSLADQNVILVFVIGGINGLEVKFLNALVSSIPLFIHLVNEITRWSSTHRVAMKVLQT